MGEAASALRRRLPARPASVREARTLVREVLDAAGRDDLGEPAVLAVSELVTNAVLHAGTPVELAAHVLGGVLRVEVADGSPHAPRPRHYAPLSGTGRGLRMLDELVDRWGVDHHAAGKTVWFEVSSGAPARPAPHRVATATASRPLAGGLVTVELQQVPLLLHAAWQVHAQALLREYLLARLDEDTAAAELEVHASAYDALALLAERIRQPELGSDPDAVMAGAIEPLVSEERVMLQVPHASVTHFAVLDRTLEHALAMARGGAFSVAPALPELRVLRRWLCGQVRDQARGLRPVPWPAVAEVTTTPARPSTSGAHADMTGAAAAVVAADEAGVITAVSRSACRLLGYDDPAALVGVRLVAIVPPRYHQAHLAGYSLHLSTGRDALLGRPVVVPVLRCDGSEVPVRLCVEVHTPGDGARVFVATLEAAQASEAGDAS